MFKQAAFILTEGCNFDCPFCFEGHDKKPNNMTDEIFEKAVNTLLFQGIKKFSLFGGEPLLNFTPKMQEVLAAHKNDITLILHTNGSLFTKELCVYFRQFKDCRISISCHNEKSIEGAKIALENLPKDMITLLVVGNHNNFLEKFNTIKPLLKKYGCRFATQFEIPGFKYNHETLMPIYQALLPYRTQLNLYDVFNNVENLPDGEDDTTEIIVTYDGKISLDKSIGLTNEDKTYPLDTPIKEIKEKQTFYTTNTEEPWQCNQCPLRDFPNISCPTRYGYTNDYSLCRRNLFNYAVYKKDINLLYSEIMLKDPEVQPYSTFSNRITSVMLNLTDQCNFRCRMCFCDWKDNYMTKETADKAIALALAHKSPDVEKVTITFFGGEPMMNYELIQYIIEKYKDVCDFSITTNGSLLTDERMEYLHDNNVNLLLSIDGDKETQDFNRPFKDSDKSTFDVLKPKFSKILEYWPWVTFRSTIIPETVHLLHHNYNFAVESGFRNFFCTPDAYSNWEGKEEILMEQAMLITQDVITAIYSGNPPVIPKFVSDGIIDYFIKTDAIDAGDVSPYRCGLGIYGFGVGASGIISACQEHSTITEDSDDLFIIGDVDSGIDEERHKNLIDRYQQQRSRWKTSMCLDCDLRSFCLGHVCPSRQGFMFGVFDKLSYADCLWTKVSYFCGLMVIKFFENNFSRNFELYLEHLLKEKGLEMKKEVEYNV